MSTIDDLAQEKPDQEIPQREAEFIESRPAFKLPSFLLADTGEGEIKDYLNHTLNFNNSMGLAQVIRGATGMLGSLNKAVFDIVFGFMRMQKKQPVVPKQEEYNI